MSVYFHQLWQVYTLEWGVDNRGGTPGAGGKESVENLGNSAQFAVNLRLLWKKKSLCKKETKPAAENSCVLCLVAQSSPALYDPRDCSPPGSSVHGDSPGKNTGVGCHTFLQGSSQPRSPTLQADSLPSEPPGKPKNSLILWLSSSAGLGAWSRCEDPEAVSQPGINQGNHSSAGSNVA